MSNNVRALPDINDVITGDDLINDSPTRVINTPVVNTPVVNTPVVNTPVVNTKIELKKNETFYHWLGLFVVLVMLGGSIGWAAIFELDQAVVASGRVIVAAKNKQVQHFDGGIVKEIRVRDGDVVNEGELLLNFDDTQLRAQLDSINGQLWEASASIVRLRAERDGGDINWDKVSLGGEEIPAEVLKTQKALLNARQESFIAEKNTLKQRKEQSKQKILALEQQVSGQNELIKGVYQQIGTQEQQIKGQYERIRAEMERVKGQGSRVQGQYQQIEGQKQQIKGQKQQATGIHGRIVGLQKRIQGAKEQIGSNYRQRKMIETDIARLEHLFQRRLIGDQDLRERRLDREQVLATIANLKAQIGDLESQIAQAKAEVGKTNTESARIQTEIGRLGSQAKNIHNETAGMNADIAGMRADTEGMKTEIGRMHSDIARIKTEIGRMMSEMTQVRESMSEIDYEVKLQKERYLTEVGEKISQLQQQLPQLRAKKENLLDGLSRVEVKSPVSGKVKGFEVTTIGAVIKPGQVIMEVVPLTQDFSIVAEINPTDIDIVDTQLQQAVEVHLSVFDDSHLFPVLYASLKNVSTDTLVNEQSGLPYYKAYLSLQDDSRKLLQEKSLQLISGMPVEVLIVAGKRTLLDYLIKPFKDIAVHAFNEN